MIRSDEKNDGTTTCIDLHQKTLCFSIVSHPAEAQVPNFTAQQKKAYKCKHKSTRGRRQRRTPLNPPPPVEGGTGVLFNGHGSGPQSGPYLDLRGFRFSGGPAHAADP